MNMKKAPVKLSIAKRRTKLMLCAAMVALAAMTACKSGTANDTDTIVEAVPDKEFTDCLSCNGRIEHDWQLMLIGEWEAVKLNKTKNIYRKEVTETFAPSFRWRFEDNGFYYETGFADGDSITSQYSYFLKNDSIMMREDEEPGISPWFVIDTLSQYKLVLTSVDSINGGMIVNTLTLTRIKK